MFSDGKRGRGDGVESSTQQNRIAHGTTIVGDIVSEGGFRIDGAIQGTIKTPGKIVVGKSGIINGTLEGTNADFEGHFSGKMKLSGVLSLKSSAFIEGEIDNRTSIVTAIILPYNIFFFIFFPQLMNI